MQEVATANKDPIAQFSGGDPTALIAVDPWAWTYFNRLQLAGGPYQLWGHEFQVDILQSTARRQCAKKSPQMGGFTEMLVIRTLHGLKYHKYPQGVIYLFPTDDEVTDFSKSRFKPFLSKNPAVIGRYVKETDTVSVKRIGKAFLYFRGSRLKSIEGTQMSSSKLKSLPVDALIADELDEMDQDAITLALGRMDHSHIKEEFYLSNPTIPDYGIDRLYQDSDQRVWTIECEACGRENVLELEFPSCLQRQRDRSVKRVCRKCQAELNSRRGYWVAQKPANKDMVGWWISHLHSIYTDPQEILDEYEDPRTDLVRFFNRRLGMAYLAAEDRLTIPDVLARCGNDAMALRDAGPCCAGADVGGRELHVLIARKSGDMLKIIRICRAPDFPALWDLCQVFGVKSLVMDLKPEIHSVRDFCQRAPFRAHGCDYSEHQKGVAVWHDAARTVTVNRTEVFDASHKQVAQAGRLELPRQDDEVMEFARQCVAVAKVLEDQRAAGNVIGKVYRYRKLAPDHYRNALNYLILAAQQVPSVMPGYAPVKEVDFYYG